MIDYNPGERTYTKEELTKRKLYESVEKGKKIYSFYDAYKRQRITNTSKEFFTDDGGYIDKYIGLMKKVRNNWTRDLFKAIEQYKANPESFTPDQYDFLRTKGKGQVETILNSIFGEFTKWYYRPLNIPVLLDN